MSPTLTGAVVGILLAATLYSVAVFAERRAGVLKPWHLVVFWLGLAVDTTATTLMSMITGGFNMDIHGILGVSAIVIMLVHSVWATVVLVRKDEVAARQFHKFSLAVWALWMVTLVTGFALSLPKVMA
ncbi:MAG: HsmA family protein [Coriobacteriia bacterium]|nr:HsmA family protein [Coriobacteriia bacterium]